MGIYINPKDTTKEDFLRGLLDEGKAKIIPHVPSAHFQTAEQCRQPEDMVVVCVVDNGAFTAAGIAFDKRELAAFVYPDERPRLFLAVHVSALADFIKPEDISHDV